MLRAAARRLLQRTDNKRRGAPSFDVAPALFEPVVQQPSQAAAQVCSDFVDQLATEGSWATSGRKASDNLALANASCGTRTRVS